MLLSFGLRDLRSFAGTLLLTKVKKAEHLFTYLERAYCYFVLLLIDFHRCSRPWTIVWNDAVNISYVTVQRVVWCPAGSFVFLRNKSINVFCNEHPSQWAHSVSKPNLKSWGCDYIILGHFKVNFELRGEVLIHLFVCQTGWCYISQKGGRQLDLWPHRLQANVGCYGKAGGEGAGPLHWSVQLQQQAGGRHPLCGQHQTNGSSGTAASADDWNGAWTDPGCLCLGVTGREPPLPGSGRAAGSLSRPGSGDDGVQSSGLSWPRLETFRWTRPAAGACCDLNGREIPKVSGSDPLEVSLQVHHFIALKRLKLKQESLS